MTPGVGSKTETAMAADPARMRVPTITCCLLMGVLLDQVVTGSSDFRARKGLSTTTVARPARGNTDGGFRGRPGSVREPRAAKYKGMGRASTSRSVDKKLAGRYAPDRLSPGFRRVFRGRDGRSRRRRSRRPPTRTVPPTAPITTLRQRELKRLVASRWTLPALVESRHRFFLPRRDEPTPILSLLVDDELAARAVHGRGTRVWHPPAQCSGPTLCSQRTQMGQVMFACCVLPQAQQLLVASPLFLERTDHIRFVGAVPPSQFGPE